MPTGPRQMLPVCVAGLVESTRARCACCQLEMAAIIQLRLPRLSRREGSKKPEPDILVFFQETLPAQDFIGSLLIKCW